MITLLTLYPTTNLAVVSDSEWAFKGAYNQGKEVEGQGLNFLHMANHLLSTLELPPHTHR